MALPGVASDVICTEAPNAVLDHKKAFGGPANTRRRLTPAR